VMMDYFEMPHNQLLDGLYAMEENTSKFLTVL
jgi:hypothetical protein